MKDKIVLNPDIIQHFKWGGTTNEWEDEAKKLSNQLETMEYINDQQKNKNPDT